eukprot:g1870.t1
MSSSDKNHSIDYFISHSWHDNAKLKLDQLQRHSDTFFSRRKRRPRYWLDKVCIDQQNITDGLRVLVVNVMACRKVLVVCGKTYTERLWCILELFVLFAFSDDEKATLRRVELLPIEDEGITRESVLKSIAEFRLDEAHCYDPNEEARLRGVMKAVGEEKFVERVRSLGQRLLELDEKGSRGSVRGTMMMGSNFNKSKSKD